jgi:hypothetical protein
MRMMLTATIPLDKGNELVRKGALGSTIEKILGEIKPEAAYFVEWDGQRTGILFVDLQKESDLPRVAEPLFLGLNATITCRPAMVPADLATAAPHIEKAAAAYK